MATQQNYMIPYTVTIDDKPIEKFGYITLHSSAEGILIIFPIGNDSKNEPLAFIRKNDK